MRRVSGRLVGAAAVFLTAAATCACGSGSSPASPSPRAALVLLASPNPVVGALCGNDCGNLPGERQALTQLSIRETGGVGANVTGGSQQLRDNGTGAIIAMSDLTVSDFVRDAGTTRIPASGQLVYHAGVHYSAAHAGAAATFTFTINATDDNGHTLTMQLAVPTTG